MKCPEPWCLSVYERRFYFDKHIQSHREYHDGPWRPEGCRGEGHTTRSFNGMVHGWVFRRDGGKCQVCGRTVGGTIRVPLGGCHGHTLIDDYQVHHILALNQGGANCMANLMTLCLRCHHSTFKRKTRSTAKTSKSLEDFP